MDLTGTGRRRKTTKTKAPPKKYRTRRTRKVSRTRLPKIIYVKRAAPYDKPTVTHPKEPTTNQVRYQEPQIPWRTNQDIWRNVQFPTYNIQPTPIQIPQPTPIQIPQPIIQPVIQPIVNPAPNPYYNPAVNNAVERTQQPETEVWYDAPSWEPVRRPTDGEADVDEAAKKKWNIDEVLDFLAKLPERARKLLLTTLFGTGVGVVIDLLLGSPIGLTSRIIRGILNIVPAGWIILGAFDGLGYLLGKGKEVLALPYDPGFVELAKRVQASIPSQTAQQIAEAADRQTGAGSFVASLAAVAHALFLRLPPR